MSLRLRLLVALVPLFVLGLAAADVATYASLQQFQLQRVDQQVIAAHVAVESYLNSSVYGNERGPTSPDGPGGGPPGPSSPSFPQGTYGELRSPSGTVLKSQSFNFGTSSTESHPNLPSSLKPGTQSSPNLLTVSGTGGISHYRVYVDTVNNSSGDIVITAFPLDDVNATLTQLLLLELAVSGGVTLVLALAAMVIVRRSLRPLEEMGDTARTVVTEGLHQRVTPATERTEVGRLGLALNTMFEELEQAFAARDASEQRLRQFISDASHELRTPLTSMRGYAELLRREPEMEHEDIGTAARRIEGEASRLGVLVDDLLLLARLDQGRALEQTRVDLEALVIDACADARVVDPGRAISAQVMAPLAVIGDDMRLRQVLSNLLKNALVHTPAGTPIDVSLRPEDGFAVIEVVDHGPGIPTAEADKIFERFHRSDPEQSRDRGGSGLGLSIVAAVTAAHRGRVSVVPTPGGGATFRIELPLTADSDPAAQNGSPSKL
ncbi:MAG TPA: HAMP domain-containing sensor histidine kinase [Candidatus Dormibacteraeota bacterium]|jgi:two-component system OmpR family sensor kinase|nr:HAMP domain-containing sensor histidine kinase [Candidatus Dormibacteraeota bacterium]